MLRYIRKVFWVPVLVKSILKNLVELITNQGVSVVEHDDVRAAFEKVMRAQSNENYPHERRNQIFGEPFLAIERGELVLIVDHTFQNIPIWVEWDEKRNTLRIAEMNGTINDTRISLSQKHRKELAVRKKILLISNQRGKTRDDKIMHYLPFLSHHN